MIEKKTIEEKLIKMQIHMEELEDRSRKNNLRIKGLKEEGQGEQLNPKVIALLENIAGDKIQDCKISR